MSITLKVKALILLIFCLTLPVKAQAAENHYYLVIEGKEFLLGKARLNGFDLLGSKVRSIKFPLDITSHLKDGLNELLLSLNAGQRVSIQIQKREKGPKIQVVFQVEFSDCSFKNKIVRLNLSDSGLDEKAGFHLSSQEEKDILSTLERYFQALEKKDTGVVKRLYSRALKIEKQFRPDLASLFKDILKKECQLIAGEQIQIKCQKADRENLNLSKVDKTTVRVSSRDGEPLIESNQIEFDPDPEILMIEGDELIASRLKTKLKRSSIELFKDRDRWYLAIPYGETVK